MEEIFSSHIFVASIRVLSFLCAVAVCYYSIKSLMARRKLKIKEWTDYSLLITAFYWALYTGYIIVVYDGKSLPPYSLYSFNMRFGLLLTLTTILALVRDRVVVATMFLELHRQIGKEQDREKCLEDD